MPCWRQLLPKAPGRGGGSTDAPAAADGGGKGDEKAASAGPGSGTPIEKLRKAEATREEVLFVEFSTVHAALLAMLLGWVG